MEALHQVLKQNSVSVMLEYVNVCAFVGGGSGRRVGMVLVIQQTMLATTDVN